MARIGASVTLDSAFRRLQGIEAQLNSGSGVVSLAVMASAEAKLLAHFYGDRSETDTDEDDAGALNDDPLTLRFLAAIEAESERIQATEK